jgi:hypothetical protein
MNNKVDASATKYHIATSTIKLLAWALNNPVPVLRKLTNADMKAFNDDGNSEYAKAQRQKKKKKIKKKAQELKHILWIWNGSGQGDTGLQEGKSRRSA